MSNNKDLVDTEDDFIMSKNFIAEKGTFQVMRIKQWMKEKKLVWFFVPLKSSNYHSENFKRGTVESFDDKNLTAVILHVGGGKIVHYTQALWKIFLKTKPVSVTKKEWYDRLLVSVGDGSNFTARASSPEMDLVKNENLKF